MKNRKKFSLIGEIADFDYHGAWGDYNSPKPLRDFLANVTAADEVEIEINSPGGNVVQGVEMANLIKNCSAHTVAHVIGVAASMASVIVCACDEIEMEEASFMMIHDPWGAAIGNADEMRKQAGVLDQMKAVIMSFYRGKFDRTPEELAALMSDETWYTGAECLANGLKCRVIASDVRAAAAITSNPFKQIPDGAAKFLNRVDLTDEGRAELAAARAAAAAPAPSSTAPVAAPSLLRASVPPCETSPAAPSAVAPAPSGNAGESPASATDWEARYKGASKKINELQAALDAANAERDRANAARDEALSSAERASARVKEFDDQLKAAGFENLAALTGAVSALKADLEKSGKDLATAREQLGHLVETRDLLTGGVLTPVNPAEAYEAKMAKAKTPEERENLRAQKRAGKIK